jgi:hypothetical protein
MANLLLTGQREAKRPNPRMRADGAIILDILNLIGSVFKFGVEKEAIPKS